MPNIPYIPYAPHPPEHYRDQFQQAIAETMAGADDPRCLRDQHRFDLPDGYRLYIAKDVVNGQPTIYVLSRIQFGTPIPLPLQAARTGIYVAVMSQNKYKEPYEGGDGHGHFKHGL